MLTAKERKIVRYVRDYGWSINGACTKWKVNSTRLRAKPEFQAALDAPKVRKAPKPADPAIDELLQEIERRSPPAVLTPTVAPVPDRSSSHGAPLSEKQPSEAENPVAAAEARTAARLAELEQEAAAKMAEKPLTQAEWVAKTFPPRFDEPLAIDGIVGLDPDLADKDPDLHATLTRPSTLQILKAGYEAADRERHQLAYHIWQKRHHESGVGGGSYMEETATMRAARLANQR